MQKNKILIAKKTLQLLENNSWEKITLLKVLKVREDSFFKNKRDLLKNLNKYFDFLLKKNLSSLEESSKKDMLFEVFMARLDILNEYRQSIKKLIKFFLKNPNELFFITPSFVESIVLMSTLSNINIDGLKGLPKLKVIFALYILTIYSWTNDETESLEKTMTALDKYLNNLDKYLNIF